MNKKKSISTIKELLEASSGEYGSKIALQIKRKGIWIRYSYKDVQERVKKIGRQLQSHGIGKGDRVAIISKNCPEWGIVYFSIISIGAIAIPIDCKCTQETVLFISTFSEVKAIFASQEVISSLKIIDALKSFKYPVLLLNIDNVYSNLENIQITPYYFQAKELKEVEIFEDEVASIIFTSGTTGNPKGVMLTHRNFIFNLLPIQKVIPCYSSDNMLSVLPLHHVFEFTSNFLYPFYGGCTITYIESLQSNLILQNMQETKTTVMPGVPQLYILLYEKIKNKLEELPKVVQGIIKSFILLNKMINSVTHKNIGKFLFFKVHENFGGEIRLFISGGAKLNPKVACFFKDLGFNLVEGYGLTETSPIISVNSIKANKIGSVGKPLPGVEVKIVNLHKSGIGEIVVRGSNVMKGYFRNEHDTQEVINNGWFYTGDLGYQDKKGYLYITGRKKDIIVTSAGKNVYPEEVEICYAKIKEIREICVFGYTTPTGEVVYAAIIPEREVLGEIKEEKIREELGKRLEERSKEIPTYQRIRNFVLWEGEFPKTSTQKIKRYKVKEKYIELINNGKELRWGTLKKR